MPRYGGTLNYIIQHVGT